MNAPVTRSGPRAVPLRGVEAALRELWAEGEGDAVRVSTGTLVVVCRPEREAEVAGVLDRLATRTPARSVVAVLGPDAGPPQAEASVVRRHGGPACERVVVRTSARRAAGAVLPLTVADMPERLWWALPEPPGSPALSEATFPGDPVIVDSLETGLNLPGDLEWVDLSWLRLAPWRAALAGLFDPPERRPLLRSVSKVRLTVAAGREGRGWAGAWLLLGWLSAKLGWGAGFRLEDGASVATPGGVARLGWAEAERPDRLPGELVGLELTAGEARFSLLAQPGLPYLVLEAEPEGISWREPLPVSDLADLVGRAFVADPPSDWEAALERARSWGLA